MTNLNFRGFLRIACCALPLLLAACSSTPSKDLPPDNPFHDDPRRNAREARAEASTLYRAARKALDSGDYSSALNKYDQIAARYPFTEYSTQSDLERIYALYRSYDPDKAIASAERFLREHPRHPAVDYVQYLKGLVNSDRETGVSAFLGLDTTKEDVSDSRRAFDDFALLVQKYPNSRFAADARQRMIFLRNRLAQHDMHVVRFYLKRGAYIAAAKRAEQVLTQYPGAPVAREALADMELCYRQLGLNQQAEDAAKLLAANTTIVSEAPGKGANAGANEHWYSRFIPGSGKQADEGKTEAVKSAPATAAPAAVKAADDDGTVPWHTFVIHTGKDQQEDAKVAGPQPAPAADAATAPETQAAGKPATDPAPQPKHSSGISIQMEPYDEWPAEKKKIAPPAPASDTSVPPTPAATPTVDTTNQTPAK